MRAKYIYEQNIRDILRPKKLSDEEFEQWKRKEFLNWWSDVASDLFSHTTYSIKKMKEIFSKYENELREMFDKGEDPNNAAWYIIDRI
jgi:hypothetical protein